MIIPEFEHDTVQNVISFLRRDSQGFWALLVCAFAEHGSHIQL